MVCLFTVIFSFKSWQETCLITHLLLVFCTIAQMAKYLSHLACVSCSYTFKLHIFVVVDKYIPVINYETFIVLYSEVHVSMYNWVIALTELIIYLKINKLDWAFLYQVIDSNKMKCDSCGFQWPTPSQMDCGKYKNVSSNIINIKS